MQNYPEQELHATVRRVYSRGGRWVADLTWHYPMADLDVEGYDLFPLVAVTRGQLDAVTKPIRVAEGEHRGWIKEAVVTRWAGHFRVTCSCKDGLEVCRTGRQAGWSRTLDGARALWSWHAAGEVGAAPLGA
ncbi:hypothetical protein [Streptomyces sp. NRRL S-350]|uniref:hypothetical protein n=1 Tax=Streptomyces sp. NRRL S-350 TaxID=1463902 RepID=UPI0004BF7C6D|nr:hypothetical protein [Streptomyces sp. NRRL S-350]